MNSYEQVNISHETLTMVLGKLLGLNIIRADYQTKQLHGGTLGDVKLVMGIAGTADGEEFPYKVVLKIQKKWDRPGDPGSWHREYDLYLSAFNKVLSDSFRWPECYHAEINGDEIQIWMEYIDGVSGSDLSLEALEQVALELGRFQGRIYQQPELMQNIACLGDIGFLEREYGQWHIQTFAYEFLCSEQCRIPEHVRQMIRNNPWNNTKTIEYNYLRSEECDIPQHLKQMLSDIDNHRDEIFNNIKRLPVVLCHRDFWIENIFSLDGKVILIDWEQAGWGYMGEDIASLIIDDTDIRYLEDYYRVLVPAYCKGLSEYMKVPPIDSLYIREMIIIKFGYRILQKHMFSQSSHVKKQQIETLQKIYEMRGENLSHF